MKQFIGDLLRILSIIILLFLNYGSEVESILTFSRIQKESSQFWLGHLNSMKEDSQNSVDYFLLDGIRTSAQRDSLHSAGLDTTGISDYVARCLDLASLHQERADSLVVEIEKFQSEE